MTLCCRKAPEHQGIGNSDDMFALSANLKFNGVSGAVYAAYASLQDDLADGQNNASHWRRRRHG